MIIYFGLILINILPLRDAGSIPTGELADVKGTPFDFTQPKKIGEDLYKKCEQLEFTGGYDHNYALSTHDILEMCAYLYAEQTGIKMEIYTDLPGLQFYSGNYIFDTPKYGKNHVLYQKGDGLCLETQFFPDAINQPNFKSRL